MSRDMEAPPRRDARATIRLRKDRFELLTRIVGATTAVGRADLLGVDRKTVYRAQIGIFGLSFMALTVTALNRHAALLAECGIVAPTLDDLFEVVEDADDETTQAAA